MGIDAAGILEPDGFVDQTEMSLVNGNGLRATTEASRDQRRRLWTEVIRSHAENMWVIPITERTIAIGVLSENFRNVPLRATQSWVIMTPGNLNPETFFWKKGE